MSDAISVITTAQIGIWNIPGRGQNFINNHYASLKNIKITTLNANGLFYNNSKLLRSVVKNGKNPDVEIIFCSILQLQNYEKADLGDFIDFFKDYRVHFALELIDGVGKKFLENSFSELKDISKNDIINLMEIDRYQDYFHKYKNNII